MTEPHHEPSYYEIALTNRQVVIAFVILLACLLAAFFSGVWIGRGGIDLHRDQLVRTTPPPQPPAEGRTLEELKFFADRPGKKGGKTEEKPVVTKPEEKAEEKPTAAPPPAPPVQQPAETTLQDDLRRPNPPPVPTRAPVVRRTPPPPAPAPEDAEPARPEPVQARPSDRSSRGKTPPAPAADAVRPGAGTVVIQVFASADQAEAQRVRERLAKGGETAFLSPLTVDGRTMYRVRIGPFGTRQQAQKAAEKVRKNFKLDTWLTE